MSITVFGSYKSVLKKFADFDGRLSRRGYWYFVLANIIVILLISILMFIVKNSSEELNGSYNNDISTIVMNLYTLVIFLPALAAQVRRLHDTDRSGWFVLLHLLVGIGSIILLVFYLQRGKQESNEYGPVPQE